MGKPLERIEYVIDNPVSSLGITVLESGFCYRNQLQPFLNKSWIRNEYLLVYLLDGKGKLESAFTGLVELKQGDLFLIPPGVWHRYGPEKGQDWYEHWIIFEGTSAEGLLMQISKSSYARRQCLLFHTGTSPELAELVEACFVKAGENSALKCTALLFEIMQRIETLNKPSVNRPENSAVRQVLQLIHTNPLTNIDFKKEVPSLGISYALFRKEFVTRTGIPPYKYLLNRRMQYACNLLADGRTVKETCYDIGMEDPSHFSKLFKNVIGLAPKKFIDKVRSSN